MKRRVEILPEEILAESSSRTSYNLARMEGIIERPLSHRSNWLPLIGFIAIALVILVRLFTLQLEEGGTWLSRAQANARSGSILFAERGVIYDRNGERLAWNEWQQGKDYALRRYSDQAGLAHVLGYLSHPQQDTKGVYYKTEYDAKAGVEDVYDTTLAGENGEAVAEENVLQEKASGAIVTPAASGQDLHLTIDAKLQNALYTSIKNLADQVHFERGAGAIMDVETGEIIALTNYPEFSRDFDSANEQAFLNLFTNGRFTPGSIVKPFMGLAALNEGVIDEYKSILSTKTVAIPNPYNPSKPTLFSDWKAHGYVDMRHAIAVSSDVYFYAVGGGLYDQKGIGIRKIDEYMKAFGIGEPVGLRGFEPVDGVIPTPEWKEANFEDGTWRLGDTFLTSIGQYGFQVTPLQMLRAVAAVANGGYLVEPHLSSSDPVNKEKVPIEINEHYYDVVREGMRLCVTTSICQALNVPYVQVAAKSGTAELGVRKDFVNSWITGFFPYDHPRYAFVVVMERGPASNLRGAVFTMRQTLDWMYTESPYYFE